MKSKLKGIVHPPQVRRDAIIFSHGHKFSLNRKGSKSFKIIVCNQLQRGTKYKNKGETILFKIYCLTGKNSGWIYCYSSSCRQVCLQFEIYFSIKEQYQFRKKIVKRKIVSLKGALALKNCLSPECFSPAKHPGSVFFFFKETLNKEDLFFLEKIFACSELFLPFEIKMSR